MSGMLSTSREALIIRSDPTLAAYIAELHDTGHDATGSAESGSTIKVVMQKGTGVHPIISGC